MKKFYWFFMVVLLAFTLCACAVDGVIEDPTSGSSCSPDEQKQDRLISVWYRSRYNTELDGKYLDPSECDLLIRVAKEADFAASEVWNLPIQFDFTIRHYNRGDGDFFANPNAEYVDVRYYLCYSSPIMARMYQTAEGYGYDAVTLSEEVIAEVKAYFSFVEALSDAEKQQIEAAWLREMGYSLPQWCQGEEKGGPCGGVHYYGTYKGYDILFISGDLAVIGTETIGEITFTHASNMSLYAHKDGQFYLLRDLCEAGDFNYGYLHTIYERHTECQQGHEIG